MRYPQCGSTRYGPLAQDYSDEVILTVRPLVEFSIGECEVRAYISIGLCQTFLQCALNHLHSDPGYVDNDGGHNT